VSYSSYRASAVNRDMTEFTFSNMPGITIYKKQSKLNNMLLQIGKTIIIFLPLNRSTFNINNKEAQQDIL
jgi:hypothetical protein